MTNEQFDLLAEAFSLPNSPTREAVRLVQVDGLTVYAAAKSCGLIQSTVSRANHKFARALQLVLDARLVA
ncbi:hypothetical protein [Crenobacter caeni]|uniref:TrfB transcriptional repressor protein domain-containing protein n=1 Tax=Crenobacter caeni TaxID=2705474 RepID=A0A6B2KU39_9NEIS|nr:hypothetical protein [Crenobacter caeni]NDV13755.1 hypothetical protein [Crenobacter caeni]